MQRHQLMRLSCIVVAALLPPTVPAEEVIDETPAAQRATGEQDVAEPASRYRPATRRPPPRYQGPLPGAPWATPFSGTLGGCCHAGRDGELYCHGAAT